MWISVRQDHSSWHFDENDCKRRLKKLTKYNRINYSRLKHPKEGNKEFFEAIKTFLFWNSIRQLKTNLNN